MNTDIKTDVIQAVRGLYATDPIAQRFLDWSAGCERDAKKTSLERIANMVGISRGEAVALVRRLEEANCGQFIVGRRGQKSRFVWSYSRIKLGQAAAGELSEIGPPEMPLADEEDDNAEGPTVDTQTETVLSISGAKRALARSLGVPEANIEITIKA